MKKHYVITSAPRFITFLVICAVLIVFITGSMLGFNDAQAVTEPVYATVTVASGDTLWDIAETYGSPDADVRQLVYEICAINSISASDLKAGDTILVPQTV